MHAPFYPRNHRAVFAVSRRAGACVIAAQPELLLLGQNRLNGDDGDFNVTPAIGGKQLFRRSNHHLYCIALPNGLRAAR